MKIIGDSTTELIEMFSLWADEPVEDFEFEFSFDIITAKNVEKTLFEHFDRYEMKVEYWVSGGILRRQYHFHVMDFMPSQMLPVLRFLRVLESGDARDQLLI